MSTKDPIPRSIEAPSITGDLGVIGADGKFQRLPVGTDGFYLQAQAAAADGTGVLWVALPGTTKGDLLMHTGTQLARFPRGLDGEILVTEDEDLGFNMTWKSMAALLVGQRSQWVGGGGILSLGTGVTRYIYPPTFSISGGETDVQAVVPALWDGATIKNLYVRAKNSMFDGTIVTTVRKNAADTALTVTHNTGESGIKKDTANSFTVAEDDLLTVKFVNNNSITRSMGAVGFEVVY